MYTPHAAPLPMKPARWQMFLPEYLEAWAGTQKKKARHPANSMWWQVQSSIPASFDSPPSRQSSVGMALIVVDTELQSSKSFEAPGVAPSCLRPVCQHYQPQLLIRPLSTFLRRNNPRCTEPSSESRAPRLHPIISFPVGAYRA